MNKTWIIVAIVIVALLFFRPGGNGGETQTASSPFSGGGGGLGDLFGDLFGSEKPSQVKPTTTPTTAAGAKNPQTLPSKKVAAASTPKPKGPANVSTKGAMTISPGWYLKKRTL